MVFIVAINRRVGVKHILVGVCSGIVFAFVLANSALAVFVGVRLRFALLGPVLCSLGSAEIAGVSRLRLVRRRVLRVVCLVAEHLAPDGFARRLLGMLTCILTDGAHAVCVGVRLRFGLLIDGRRVHISAVFALRRRGDGIHLRMRRVAQVSILLDLRILRHFRARMRAFVLANGADVLAAGLFHIGMRRAYTLLLARYRSLGFAVLAGVSRLRLVRRRVLRVVCLVAEHLAPDGFARRLLGMLARVLADGTHAVFVGVRLRFSLLVNRRRVHIIAVFAVRRSGDGVYRRMRRVVQVGVLLELRIFLHFRARMRAFVLADGADVLLAGLFHIGMRRAYTLLLARYRSLGFAVLAGVSRLRLVRRRVLRVVCLVAEHLAQDGFARRLLRMLAFVTALGALAPFVGVADSFARFGFSAFNLYVSTD